MNRALIAVGVVGVLTYCVPTTTTKAISINDTATYSDDVQPREIGLIFQYSLSISASSKMIVGNL